MTDTDVRSTVRPAIEVGFAHADIATVALSGEHDLASAPRLGEALAAASARPGLLVDLSTCTFIDSSVIAAFAKTRRELAAQGGRLELVIPVEAVELRRIAEVALLDSIVPISETHEAGIARLQLGARVMGILGRQDVCGDTNARTAGRTSGRRGETPAAQGTSARGA